MIDLRVTIKNCLILLKASILYSFQQETAFIANNWTNLLSTTIYTLTWIGSIEVIYANVNTLAGYTKDEMLVFSLAGQLVYYFIAGLLARNIYNFVRAVNNGSLDLLLVRPLPALFYSMIKSMNLVGIMRDAVIPLLSLILLINWQVIAITPLSLIIGLIVMFIGCLTLYMIFFLFSLPTILIGEGESLVDLGAHLIFETMSSVPYEGFNGFPAVQQIFTVFIPVLLAGGLSVSVILQKVEALPVLIWTLISFVLVTFITIGLWKLALRSYSSASS